MSHRRQQCGVGNAAVARGTRIQTVYWNSRRRHSISHGSTRRVERAQCHPRARSFIRATGRHRDCAGELRRRHRSTPDSGRAGFARASAWTRSLADRQDALLPFDGSNVSGRPGKSLGTESWSGAPTVLFVTVGKSHLFLSLVAAGRAGCVCGLGRRLQLLVCLDQEISCLLRMALHIVAVVFLRGFDVSVGFNYMQLCRCQHRMLALVDVLYRFLCERHTAEQRRAENRSDHQACLIHEIPPWRIAEFGLPVIPTLRCTVWISVTLDIFFAACSIQRSSRKSTVIPSNAPAASCGIHINVRYLHICEMATYAD